MLQDELLLEYNYQDNYWPDLKMNRIIIRKGSFNHRVRFINNKLYYSLKKYVYIHLLL